MTRPRRCRACGATSELTTAEQAEALYKYLLRAFSADPVAHGVVVEGFAAMERPAAEGGGGCPNHLDAFLGMCRSAVGEFGASR